MNNYHRYKIVDTIEERLDHLASLIEQGCLLISSDVGMDAYYQACSIEVSAMVADLELELQAIRDNVALYPKEEAFGLDYNKHLCRFEEIRQCLKRSRSVAESRLVGDLNGLKARLKAMQNAVQNPNKEMRLKKYDNLLNHYHDDFWDDDWQQYEMNTLSNFSEKPAKLQQQLEREHRRLLERLYNCEFMKARVADNDDNAQEAYESLLDKNGRDELSASQVSAYIASHCGSWKGYATVNTFFRLHLIICYLNKRLADFAKSQEETEAESRRKLIEETLDPLEQHLGAGRWKGHWRELWTSLFADPLLAEILKKEELNENFNLKLVLNIVGIMISEQVLTCNVNQANGLMFGTIRRNDYMAIQHYQSYGSGKSALTAAAESRIKEILLG